MTCMSVVVLARAGTALAAWHPKGFAGMNWGLPSASDAGISRVLPARIILDVLAFLANFVLCAI